MCIFPPQTYLFLIEGKLLHSVVLASAMHQHELVTGTPVSRLYLTSFPPPTLSRPSRLSVSICFKGTLVTNPVGTWQSVTHLWGMKAPEKCLERTEFEQPFPRKCVNHQYLIFSLVSIMQIYSLKLPANYSAASCQSNFRISLPL